MTTTPLRQILANAIGLAGAIALATTVTAQPKPDKNEEKRQKELQEAMQREARPVVTAINQLEKNATGQPQAVIVNPKEDDPAKAVTPASPAVDAKVFTWRYDTMKAADGKVYVPYTVSLPAEAVPSGPMAIYMRVVPKGQAAAAAPPKTDAKEGEGKEEIMEEILYPFEDYFSNEVRAAAGQPLRIMRAFAATPGEYDIYFGIRPKPADPKKANEPVRVVAFKHNATLPNYWNGELTTSSVVVTNKVEQVQGQPSPDLQRERPYLFGTTEFVPSPDNKFKKTEELSVVFQIYNPTLEAGKPNVTIEYNFHQKLAEGEKFFNKTTPQQLNGQTLPATFDVAATQMLPGGQSVPLASFPPGDYRMEIKITDAIAKKTITRDIPFSVLGA